MQRPAPYKPFSLAIPTVCLGILSIALSLAACESKHSVMPTAAILQFAHSSTAQDSPVTAENTVQEPQNEPSASYYCTSPKFDPTDPAAQELIGKQVADLEDSTLLKLVYGSCYAADDYYAYNWGPQMWNEEDSVYMQVQERLGNDSIQVIYLRGEYAITDVMHNHFIETALLLEDIDGTWTVVDAYVDAETIDFDHVDLVGEYMDRMLIVYSTSGVYAGGVSFASDEYKLLEPHHLRGPAIPFIRGRSNTASDQCYNAEELEDYHCDCYESEGALEFNMDSKWKCLSFLYNLDTQNGDCGMEYVKTTHAQQKWLMNRDTAFQIKGDSLSEWGEAVVGKVNKSNARIKQLLRARQ